MTTEVLRNMIYAASPALDGLRYVVLDEVHYLQDRYRGAVWEEVIIHLAADGRPGVPLGHGVERRGGRRRGSRPSAAPPTAVIEERRPVDARRTCTWWGSGAATRIHLLPDVRRRDRTASSRPNPEAARLDARAHDPARGRAAGPRTPPAHAAAASRLVELLAARGDAARRSCSSSAAPGATRRSSSASPPGCGSPTPTSAREIRAIAEAKTRALTDDDLDVLGYDAWLAGLEAGFAAHHAGMVPPMKEAVEEAFAAGLVKVVFATETLVARASTCRPARWSSRSCRSSPASATSSSRRGSTRSSPGGPGGAGIDDVGYAVVCWSPFVPFDQVASLASRRTDALRVVVPPDLQHGRQPRAPLHAAEAHHLLNLSFAQFHADRDVVALERQLERSRAAARAPARAPRTATSATSRSTARLQGELDTPRRNGARRTAAWPRRCDALRARRRRRGPPPRRAAGRCSTTSTGAAARSRLVALSPSRDVVRLGPAGLRRAAAAGRHHRAADSRSRRGTRRSAGRPPSGCGG